MALRADPRRDLPVPDIQGLLPPRPNSLQSIRGQRQATTNALAVKNLKGSQCYDWMFCTASNIHVAVDKASFKTYIPFKSYIRTMSQQRQVPVRGIGTCEIKIKREPGSNDHHTVTLEDVLHVPDWVCNILSSDACFVPAKDYEYTEDKFGFKFMHWDGAVWRPWGYTENFCSLDRLVLSRVHKGRSPMLEDPDREVFSISLTWPQSQRVRWELEIAAMTKRATGEFGKDKTRKSLRAWATGKPSDVTMVQDTTYHLVEYDSEESKGLQTTSHNATREMTRGSSSVRL